MIRIYALVDPRNPDTIRYIGKTKMTLRKRLQSHIDESRSSGRNYKKRTHKINWINSLLISDIKPEIKELEICTEEDWPKREMYFIEKYRSLFPLTNTSDGGYGGAIGITRSIIQYSTDGELMKIFNSIEEACTELNIERGVINSALQRNPQGGYGGNYIWAYYTNKYAEFVPPYFIKKLIVRIKDLESKECRVFLSLTEALSHFNIKRCGAVNEAINKRLPYKKRYSIVVID